MHENETHERQVGGDHYTSLSVQPWEAMRSWMTAVEYLGFLRGNAIKYLARKGSKSESDDVAKAHHYLEEYLRFYKETYESCPPLFGDVCIPSLTKKEVATLDAWLLKLPTLLDVVAVQRLDNIWYALPSPYRLDPNWILNHKDPVEFTIHSHLGTVKSIRFGNYKENWNCAALGWYKPVAEKPLTDLPIDPS